jgi:hypothetical protein
MTIGTFADDTAIFATHDNPITASSHLQENLSSEAWLNKWKIKVNESKSTQTTFTLQKGICQSVQINHINIPLKDQVKYLGLNFDCKLNWRQHITKKRKQMDQKTKELNWHTGKNFYLSIDKPVTNIQNSHQAYMDIWHRTLRLCQQNKHCHNTEILCSIINAPWYVSNRTLHKDLKTPYVSETIRENSTKHCNKLENHSNPLLQPLLQPHENCRLKRNWPADLRN